MARRFVTDGRGTLAPWDPPRELVVRGLYRYVRNPMISGVVSILVGEALLLASRPHLRWALIFLGINAVYIALLEDPLLARLLPRLRSWEPRAGNPRPRYMTRAFNGGGPS